MNAFVWVTQLAATVEIALGMPDAAIVLLELARRHAEGLEFFENTDVLDTAAAYWERRAEALDACAFLIDRLKTDAAFWKKEHRADGGEGDWVEARDADDQAADRWRKA